MPMDEETPAELSVANSSRRNNSDVSRRSQSVARVLDRLPDGNFILTLEKSDFIWRVRVHRTIPVQDLELKT